MKRTTISLLATATALAAITGFASLTAPGDGTAAGPAAAARLPVERSSLLCPAPSGSETAETRYTSFTPKGTAGRGGGTGRGTAELRPSAGAPAGESTDVMRPDAKVPAAKPLLTLKEPGTPGAAEESGAKTPALVGTATGRLAPGWTAQQTTTVTAGSARGVLGLSCTAPDTEFWIPGASTAEGRQDYVHLTNPDDSPAVVDLELYGKDGELQTTLTEGIPLRPGAGLPIMLSTLTAEIAPDVTVHVSTRAGRVGAAVHAAEDKAGSDWISGAADPAPAQVLPGIPADATSVRLIVFAPGRNDADLKIELAGPTGRIVPAGGETLHVKSGMTAGLELGDVTKGEAGSLILTPESADRATPVVAALRVARGKGEKQEIAFIPATAPVGERASVSDNREAGTTLSLTAPTTAARVRVTASAGTEGGEPAVKSYTVKAGTTLAVTPPVPAGLKGSYALTVETESGGPVHAARTLELPERKIPMFTVQTLPDDRGTVSVPRAGQDLSVLDD
ncbi:DUF5719 family protein [Streptomyces sp. CAU 1734]|uniref:DUF5719 family protein n=1 Tax=Streptomyces sp. CAU 1734 TaxID=3140360 RepID=UPI0032615A2C